MHRQLRSSRISQLVPVRLSIKFHVQIVQDVSHDNKALIRRKLRMFTVKRLLTLAVCFCVLLPVFVFNAFVGGILAHVGNAVGLVLLGIAIVLCFLLSVCLAFSKAFPWCRKDDRSSNSLSGRVCISISLLAVLILIFLYSSITFMDGKPHKINLATVGMSKAQVLAAVGPPDWQEGLLLWAYRVKGDGVTGILTPYYFTFNKNGVLVSVHS